MLAGAILGAALEVNEMKPNKIEEISKDVRAISRMLEELAKFARKEQPAPHFKKWISPTEVEKSYGISQSKLRRMRVFNEGPPYKQFGHRTVMYNTFALERWIDGLPGGGDEQTLRKR